MNKNTTRIIVTISSSTKDAIKLLADSYDTKESDIIRNFMAFGLATESLIEMGYEIVAKDDKNEWLMANSLFQMQAM